MQTRMDVVLEARVCVCVRVCVYAGVRTVAFTQSYLPEAELNNRETRSAKSTTCWYLAYLRSAVRVAGYIALFFHQIIPTPAMAESAIGRYIAARTNETNLPCQNR